MNRFPLVSIIIPTYNRPNMLTKTIKSVLNQSYKNIEIIIVDDNNPGTLARNETEIVMKQYINHEKIKYIQHEKNRNGSAARNTGFASSEGEYIMFLDDDDEFFKHKVLKQVENMEQLDETWGMSYTSYIRKNKGKIIGKYADNKEGDLFKEVLARNIFLSAGSNLMLRRKAISDVHGFDESFQRNQDIEFLVRLFRKYKIAYVDYVGLVINKDDNSNRSINMFEVTNRFIQKFSTHINTLSNDDKAYVYKHLNLQITRYYIFNLQIFKAIKYCFKQKVSVFLLLRYFIYLGKRFIAKKIYAFEL